MSETNLQLFPGVFRSTVGGENPGFFLHSDGRVGIGNKAPTARPLWSSDDADRNKLNVTGHTHIDGNLNVTGHLYGDGSTLSGVAAVIGGYWDLDASNNNISYSAGNVGIGGVANTNKLKVHGTVEATSFSGILATDVPTLDTSKISGLGSFATLSSYPTVTQTDFRWTMGGTGTTSHANYGGHGDWYIRSNHGSGKVILQDTGGKVGVGTSNPIAKLHVSGSTYFVVNAGWLTYFGPYGGNLSHNSSASWSAGSIYATSHIITQGYHVSGAGSITASDSRIKKEIVDVEDVAALEILRLLKPKKYKYVDEVKRGTEPVWGFIAQEVRDTLPHATHLITECIPNIYEVANVSASNVITLTNFDTSTLDSNAVLKVFDKDDKEHLVTITDIVDEHSIRVDEDLSELTGSIDESGNVVAGNRLFVYGQQVDDFVFLKKDSIYTVATAALQEVDRQLQAEKEKVASLEERLAVLEAIVLNQ